VKDRARQAIRSIRQALTALPQSGKASIAFAVDLIGFSLCVVAALWLVHLAPYVVPYLLVVAVTAFASVFFAWLQGMYRSVVRYMGFDMFIVGARSALGSAVIGAVLMQNLVFDATPYRWAAAYAAFSFIYICGSRYLARLFLVERRAQKHRERVIIYGAGSAGAELATNLHDGDEYLAVVMLDDDSTLHGKKVKGLEVHPPSDLASLCRKFDVKRIFLAMPRAESHSRRQVLEHLSEFPIRVQTVPSFGEIVSGKASVDDISDVDVKDLLGRAPVPPNPHLLRACVTGKSVLISGAGGSIGSELCRQLLALNPKRLVLLEISEPALYNINKELQGIHQKTESNCEIIPLLGSAYNEARARDALQSFSVQTVYHTAAYKHVPLVEQNLFEGIQNNVFGTLHIARAAMECGVESFVLISSDKAVNPTNIMGATKRLAELILQAAEDKTHRTRFSMVRFGNVLESSGSVVPLFREQIRKGGPITVTHRDIIRYFMTIPEAAELVIQAGSMAKGGDVFVLDMGEPVRIQDLAYRMVNLMGHTVKDERNPEGDIAIEYIGLRPAEKLYGELLIGSNVSGTEHPRILRADEDYLEYDSLAKLVGEMEIALEDLDYKQAHSLLCMAVEEYSPADDVADWVWLSQSDELSSETADTVVEFPGKTA
jgi:FlaA1/EpsC-like NDP-sugar epimerase